MPRQTETPRARHKRVREATRTLWRDLCEAHGLRLSERRLLKRAARDLGFTYPAVIFFRPSSLGAYVREQREALSEDRRDTFRRLAQRLFADHRIEEFEDTGPLGDDGLPHGFAPDELEDLRPS